MTLTEPQGSAAENWGIVPLEGAPKGVAFVPLATPLERLNYFDGKFLRAEDLQLEQRAQRALVHLSNRAGGAGVVSGLDLSAAPSAGTLALSGGLAIDPAGQVLYLPDSVEVPVADLLAAARSVTGTGTAPGTAAGTAAAGAGFVPCAVDLDTGVHAPLVEGVQLYLVALVHAEALCGHEEVFGRMCQQACATASDRPYRNEGVAVLLLPLPVGLGNDPDDVPFTPLQLRSRVASAWFAQERTDAGSWLSAAAIREAAWCAGAGPLAGAAVPIAVLAWRSPDVVFVDPWTVRRERMESPPRAYWAGRLEARPWSVFLAQVLQFQCHLSATTPGLDGVCTTLLGESTGLVDALVRELAVHDPQNGTSAAALADLRARTVGFLQAAEGAKTGAAFLDRGLRELPPAGFLPVDATGSVALRDQLTPLFGPGVDLRFCAVRRDQIASEFEIAQHLDRISLVRGRTDARLIEQVDVLVPDGTMERVDRVGNTFGFAVDLAVGEDRQRDNPGGDGPLVAAVSAAASSKIPLRGVGRLDTEEGGFRAHLAAVGTAKGLDSLLRLATAVTSEAGETLAKAARIKVRPNENTPADVRTLAGAMRRAVAASRSDPRGTRRVISLPAARDTEAIAVWASGLIGKDPFTAEEGADLTVRFKLAAFVPNTRQSALAEFTLDGQARVLPRKGLDDAVNLLITGTYSSTTVNLRAQDVLQKVSFKVRLSRSVQGAATTLLLSGLEDQAGWAVRLAWSGDPIEAKGEILARGRGTTGTDRTLVTARAQQNPAVNLVGNAHHDRAVDALTILQGAMIDNPYFLDTALKTLFPGGESTHAELRPRTDWVLFRRRTRKDCDDARETPAPVSRVAVVVTTLTSKKEALALAESLRNGAGEVAWRRLTGVEFEGSTAQFRAYPSFLPDDYTGAAGGSTIAFVGYSSAGEVASTGIARARRVAGALAPVAEMDPDDVDVLPGGLAGVPAPGAGTEGTILLVSYAEHDVVTGCVEVINVVPDDDDSRQDVLEEALRAGDRGTLEEDQYARLFTAIGKVNFDPDPDAGEVDEVQTALQKFAETDPNKERRVSYAYGWTAADLSADEAAAKNQQLQTLATLLKLDLKTSVVVDFSHAESCSARFYVFQRIVRLN